MVIGSIAGSAAIWGTAALVLVITSWLFNALEPVTHRPPIDLFKAWISPTLQAHDFGPASVLPGVMLSALSLAGGVLVASLLRGKDGKFRRWSFQKGRFRLQFDPNPRVWSWFLQAPDSGRLLRVTLKSGRVLVGQVSEYSTDPEDDRQEIVMVEYAVAASEEHDLHVDVQARRVLISRDDIELIEELAQELPESGDATIGSSP